MSGSMEPVLAAIAGLGLQIGRLDERLGRVEEGLTRVEERSTRVEERLDRLDTGATQLRVEVMARLDRQQDELTRIRDDIGVNYGSVDAVRKQRNQFRNDYQQLASQVSVVHRRRRDLEQRFDHRDSGT